MRRDVIQGTLVVVGGIILLFFLLDRIGEKERGGELTLVTDNDTFETYYGHYRLSMSEIIRLLQDSRDQGDLDAAQAVCDSIPIWRELSQNAIEFVEEYRPQVADKDLLASLDHIETQARFHLTTLDRLEPYCNDSQIQIFDILSR